MHKPIPVCVNGKRHKITSHCIDRYFERCHSQKKSITHLKTLFKKSRLVLNVNRIGRNVSVKSIKDLKLYRRSGDFLFCIDGTNSNVLTITRPHKKAMVYWKTIKQGG